MSRNLQLKKCLGVKSSFKNVCIHRETSLGLQLAVLGSKTNILCFVWQLIRHNLLTDNISFIVTQPALQWSAKELLLMTSTFFELENISYHNPVATENTGLKQTWLFASLSQQYAQCLPWKAASLTWSWNPRVTLRFMTWAFGSHTVHRKIILILLRDLLPLVFKVAAFGSGGYFSKFLGNVRVNWSIMM